MSAAVEKILEQVKHLNSREQKEFWERIAVEEAKHLDEWEQEIERDSNAGELDHLLAELKDDINGVIVKPGMKSLTNRRFWESYRRLPGTVRRDARKTYRTPSTAG